MVNLSCPKMILFIVLVSSHIVITIDDCNACVEGQCHSKITLMKNVDITDQLAIDWTDNILYVQLNSFLNTAFYIKNFSLLKMHVVQALETSGMTVNQDTQELYTADLNNNVYKIKKGTNTVKLVSHGVLGGTAALLFFRKKLYLSKKGFKNVFYIDEAKQLIAARDLVNFTITDFVKTERGAIFLADDIVYEYKWPYNKPPKVLASKKIALSIDKYENLYLGAASQKVIYKRTTETNKVLIYAAYTEGSVERFVFDKNNNIIAHDAVNKTISIWKREKHGCTIMLPHCGVHINVHKPPNSLEPADEENDNNDAINSDENIVYDFFWKEGQSDYKNIN